MEAELSESDVSAETGGRVRPRYGRARQTILAAADRLLRQVPLDALSIEDIAAAAGLSRRTVYNQFEGKDDLFRASRERHLQALARMVDTDLEDDDETALIDFAVRAARLFASEAHADVMVSLVRDGHGQPWLAAAYRQQLTVPLCRAVESWLLRRGLATGRYSVDPRRDAQQFVTLFQGLNAGRLMGCGSDGLEELDAGFIGLVAKGFLARWTGGEAGGMEYAPQTLMPFSPYSSQQFHS